MEYINKRKKVSEETKMKMRLAKLGRKQTDEHKQKISRALKGKKPKNLEMIQKMRKGSKHSEESRMKMSKAKKGIYIKEKAGNWKGGIHDYPYEFTEELKQIVRKKFDFECACCLVHQKELGISLSVHHINQNKKDNVIENLLPLCQGCHLSLHRSF